MAGHNSIQILRGSQTFDPSTSDQVLLDGQPFYSKRNGKLYIGNGEKLQDLDDVAALNLDRDTGSVSQKDQLYTGNSVMFSDGTKGPQKGDIVPGAIASGYGAAAFGGLKYDYYTSPITHSQNLTIDSTATENWGRTPTSAEGNQSFAAGGSVHAYGDWSVVFNKDTSAYQRASFSIGGGTRAGCLYEEYLEQNNLQDTQENKDNYSSTCSFALATGEVTKATGRSSISGGFKTLAQGRNSVALGEETTALGESSFAMGKRAISKGKYSVCLGYQQDGSKGAVGIYSIATGSDTLAEGSSSISGGYLTHAKGSYGVAFGAKTLAEGNSSFSTGLSTKALGDQSVACGFNSTAQGKSSFAIGQSTKAIGDQSVAVGQLTQASGNESFAGGYNSKATRASTFAFGTDCEAKSDYSTAIGKQAISSGYSSVAVGQNVSSSGNTSVAIGRDLVCSNYGSIGIGQNNISGANYDCLFGKDLIGVSAPDTLTNSLAGLVILGRFNSNNYDSLTEIYGRPRLIVGNGLSANNRGNAFEIFQDNTSRFNGNLVIKDYYNQQTYLNVAENIDRLNSVNLLPKGNYKFNYSYISFRMPFSVPLVIDGFKELGRAEIQFDFIANYAHQQYEVHYSLWKNSTENPNKVEHVVGYTRKLNPSDAIDSEYLDIMFPDDLFVQGSNDNIFVLTTKIKDITIPGFKAYIVKAGDYNDYEFVMQIPEYYLYNRMLDNITYRGTLSATAVGGPSEGISKTELLVNAFIRNKENSLQLPITNNSKTYLEIPSDNLTPLVF